MQQKSLLVGLIAAVVLALVFAGSAMISTKNVSAQIILDNSTDQFETPPGNLTDTQTAANGTQVEVGKGSNTTVQYYTYTPSQVEIDAGESVTWTSTAQMVELHTVTFSDPSIITDIILPFGISDDEPKVMPPFNAGEPVTMETPNGTAIVGVNKLAFYPSVIDANNQTSYPNGTDIVHTMAGDEKVVNSGIIQPPFPPSFIAEDTIQNDSSMMMNDTSAVDDLDGPPFPFVTSFTVTFEEPGTYDYFCALHPWMTGQVVVNGETGTASLGQSGSNTTTMGSPGANMTTFEEMANSTEP
jgi:plastocyanin